MLPFYSIIVVMKWFIYSLLFLLPSSISASDWTEADTVRESAWLALWVVDWGQTRTIAKKTDDFPFLGLYDVPRYEEKNHFLGKHPTVKEVNHYFARGALVHYGISKVLSPKYRKMFQYISIVYEADAVYKNYRVGINVSF